MKTITIWKKECLNHFTSLRAYVMGALVLAFMAAIFFVSTLNEGRDASLRWMMGADAFVFLAITPILTMRILSEESKSGTLELLLTSPVNEWDIVLGKFLGVLTLYLAFFAICLVYPITLMIISTPEKGPMLAQYLGLILCCSAFISVGIFSSSVTESQVTAAVISYMLLLTFWIGGFFADFLPEKGGAVLRSLSLVSHLENNFGKGVIDAVDVFFYLAFVFSFLFLAQRSIEARRWAT